MANVKTASFLSASPKVEVRQIISILPDSYLLLEDKPAINGVELTKDSTPKDLCLLSGDADDYMGLTYDEATESEAAILAITNTGEAAKISVSELSDALASTIKTVEELDENAKDGSYQFLIKN